MKQHTAEEQIRRRTQDMISLIDYLDRDVRQISPTGAHFLQMAKAALANPHWDSAEPLDNTSILGVDAAE